MNIAQNVKSALATVGLAGLVLLATACDTPKPTLQMATPTQKAATPVFSPPKFYWGRSNGDLESLDINPQYQVPGQRAIATLVGPDKAFYTVLGFCDGTATAVGPMGSSDHATVGDFPLSQQAMYTDLQNRFAQMVKEARDLRPDCSFQR